MYSYLFAALLSIGFFTYLTALTPYVLRVNLGLDESVFGKVSGNLQFWQELVLLSLLGWWGAMSDRYGRRPIYITGFLILTLGYAIYPFAGNVSELIAFRLIFAVGIAATSALLAAVLADYPAEESRGKLTGLAFFLNGIGSVVFFMGLTKLPAIYASGGADELWAGRYAYLSVAALAFLAAIVMLGLKPGRPDHVLKSAAKIPVHRLMFEGLRAARNPRILVAYLSAAASRADMAIITLFLILWIQNAGIAGGATAVEAAAKAGMTVGIAQMSAVLWAPFFGYIADRVDRLTLLIIGFAISTLGYYWVAIQPDILSSAALPALLCMGLGLSSTSLAAAVVLGEEAPEEIRGSAFGMQSLFGALGILVLSYAGGRMFDAIGPYAPFYAIAAANGVVLVVGMVVRFRELRSTGNTDWLKNP